MLTLLPASMAQAATSIPVQDLKTTDIPATYNQFVLDTTKLKLSSLTFTQGEWLKQDTGGSTYYWPLKIGATATISNIGGWEDPDGVNHVINATISLKKWNGGALGSYKTTGSSFWIFAGDPTGQSGAGYPSQVTDALGKVDSSKRIGCQWQLTFTYADGTTVPSTFKGVTGFNDLDGLDTQPDIPFEGVELVNGFDGAYKTGDAELTGFGVNGFAGFKHDAGDETNLNGRQQTKHRLSATWSGSGFTFAYTLAAGSAGNVKTTFGTPIRRLYPLKYDLNGGTGTGPQQYD